MLVEQGMNWFWKEKERTIAYIKIREIENFGHNPPLYTLNSELNCFISFRS